MKNIFVAALVCGLAGLSPMAANADTTVENLMDQYKAASADAGAKTLMNQTAGEYLDDAGVTTKVKANILAQEGLDSFDIHVTTMNGIVTLTGEVDSTAQVTLAGRVAKDTSDVKGVINKLTTSTPASINVKSYTVAQNRDCVSGTDYRNNPDYRGVNYSGNNYISDNAVSDQIRQRLNQEVDLRDAEIVVETRDGVVRLTGEVRDDNAKHLADQVAREADGWSRIENDLKVYWKTDN